MTCPRVIAQLSNRFPPFFRLRAGSECSFLRLWAAQWRAPSPSHCSCPRIIEGACPLVLLHLTEDRLHEDEIAALADARQLKAGGERGDGNRSAGLARIT